MWIGPHLATPETTGLSDITIYRKPIMTKHYSPVFCCCLFCGDEQRSSDLQQHNYSHHQNIYPPKPKFLGNCLQCDKEMRGYERDKKKFCGRSCAAKYNNAQRPPDFIYGPKSKYPGLSKAEKDAIWKFNRSWKKDIDGPYTPLKHNKCATCGIITIGRRQQKYCEAHTNNYSHNQRAKYWFAFYLGDYPELFDFSLLKKYGMRTNQNQNGVVRDHRVSVADAIKNNYDPYYITHPLNCELMLHSDNSKKYTKSSITYEELVKMVDEWELNKSLNNDE